MPHTMPDGVALGSWGLGFRLGGQHVQATVVNQEDLRAAMAEPGTWGHLIVRVGGFPEHFVKLNRTLQESILARVSYG